MNLRSKAKNSTAPDATTIAGPSAPAPTASDNIRLSRESLEKLTRPALQKLAKTHQVKANLKKDLIIQQLLDLPQAKRTRPAEDDAEGPESRKRFKRGAAPERTSTLRNGATPPDAPPTRNMPSAQLSAQQPREPEAGPSSGPHCATPSRGTEICYDRNLFSETESEMTEEEQADFATPVSSRSGPPPRAHINDLKRCVRIMQQISAKDQELLRQIDELQERAWKIRRQANEVRTLVKIERARRERMEAYFRHWQETEGRWDREWMYGKENASEDKIRQDGQDGPAGSSAPLSARQSVEGRQTVDDEQQPLPIPQPRPMLSPGELKRKREAIISKQEAEQRELEALQRNRSHG